MLLTINQIISWHDDATSEKWDERVLHIFSDTQQVALINVEDKDALPILRSIEELEEEVESGNAIPLQGDPYAPPHFTEEELDSKALRTFKCRRDRALMIIEPLFEQENAVRMLFPTDRSALIKERRKQIASWPKKDRACEKTIYRYCRRRWQRGQIPNAQLPRYDNCGARRGKPRKITKKLGRPSRLMQHSRKSTEEHIITGANMTPAWLEKIKDGGKLFYEHRLNPNFGWAYRRTLERFFIKDKIIENGKERIITLDPNKGEIFTLGQFRYHYLLNRDARRALKKRSGQKQFNTQHRELRGKSMALGPGFSYLIDATIANVYLRSRYDARLIVGRPVIWVMIDLFSRMITGVCVRLEGEGWLGLSLAIENTVEDKVAFCAKYGIGITEEQWPARHRPVEILGDRGPLIHEAIHRFIKAFNVVISNTPPFRPDWKGIVERIFGEMNIRVFKWLPGYVIPEPDPSDPNYRLAAVLDIEELTAIIIAAVLHHNNECLVSDGVEIEPQFLAENLDPYPTKIFTWGATHKPGGLREADFDSVRRSLLLEGKISITKGEIRFRHPKAPKPLIYKCDEIDNEGLLLRGTGVKGRQYTALYDLRWANEIYLIRRAGGELIPCRLRDEQSIHANRDWAEVVQYLEEVQLQRDRKGSVVLQDQVNFEQQLRKRVLRAKSELNKALANGPEQSNAAILRAIPSNRKAETSLMHEEEANQLRISKPPNTANSATRSSSKVERKANRYSRGPQVPNIADLRRKKIGR